MKTNHIPVKWELYLNASATGAPFQIHESRTTVAGKFIHTVATVDFNYETASPVGISRNEALANAKLIASAPELLAAVQMYLRIIEDEGCIPDVEQIELDDKMRTALNKAFE